MVSFIVSLFKSQWALSQRIRLLEVKLSRRAEEIDSLTRQRDVALECLDKVKWDSRAVVSQSMAYVDQFGKSKQ